MAKSFSVDIDKLETSIRSIDEKIENYERQYQQLLQEISGLETAWQGADTSDFLIEINELTGKLMKVLQFMKNYSKHLKLLSKTYRETQGEIASLAKRL